MQINTANAAICLRSWFALKKATGLTCITPPMTSAGMTTLRSATRIVAATAILFATACASYRPVPLDELTFQDRVETQEAGGLRVSVSVLSREEAKQAFGVGLHKRGIQPIWLEIENKTGKPFWFMMSGIDPNYFSAHEAAYMNHFFMGGQTNREMDAYFSDLGLDQSVQPGQTNTGFAFTNETVGTKQVRVKLYSNKDVRTFDFYVSVPGVASGWDWEELLALVEETEVDIKTEAELQAALRALPCCTQRADGSGEGDPLNLVMIGGVPTLKAFIQSGWDHTAFQRDFRALFGAAYLYGREPDVQFRKSRRRVDSMNLVRLWVSPIKYRGEIVIVGSVSRSIDPNVDEAVLYVVEDLATAETVQRFGRVAGVGAVSRAAPRRNFANAAYWTSGYRAVLQMTDDPTRLEDVNFYDWDYERLLRRVGEE